MELNIETQKQEFLTICQASISREGLLLSRASKMADPKLYLCD